MDEKDNYPFDVLLHVVPRPSLIRGNGGNPVPVFISTILMDHIVLLIVNQ